MEQLQQEMTRFYGHLRPRHSNPTYASTNLGSSLGTYAPFIYRNLQNSYSYSDLKPINKQTPNQSQRYRRSSSQLSNIASNSLKTGKYLISDKQVYEKQQKDYNIISVQPNIYQNTIKMYPIYRLQHEDKNYFRKMQLEEELSNKLKTRREAPPQLNPEKAAKPILRGKYLNNLDEVADII